MLIDGFLVVYAGLPAFIVTLGMLGIAQGLALLLSNGRSLCGFPESFEIVGGGSFLGVPVPVAIPPRPVHPGPRIERRRPLTDRRLVF